MRMACLCLLLFGPVAVAGAESQPPALLTQEYKAVFSARNFQTKKPMLVVPDGSWTAKRVPRWSGASRSTCYVMDTYQMKREAPDSDVTHMVGRSTCLPSQGVELAPAIAGPHTKPH